MAEIINLRRARKTKAREEAAAAAAQNRASHGRSKAKRAQANALSTLDARRLDGAKRETDTDD